MTAHHRQQKTGPPMLGRLLLLDLLVLLPFNYSRAFYLQPALWSLQWGSRLYNAASVEEMTASAASPAIFPARLPLSSFFPSSSSPSFSILSWNILLPNSRDNWWCHKQYASHVEMSKRTWSHRRQLIQTRLSETKADIVCIQEADGSTFTSDFDYMNELGYDYVLHKKFRFRCATFYQRNKFTCIKEAHKDRTLVTTLEYRKSNDKLRNDNVDELFVLQTSDEFVIHVVNCHLSGGAAPERRLRQVNDGLAQICKWNRALEREVLAQQQQQQQQSNKKRKTSSDPTEKIMERHRNAGIVVCGDFNSDGNTGVRKLLVDGYVDPNWYEPQYPNLKLTSRRLEHTFGPLVDVYESVYGSNVCDGDYADNVVQSSLGHGKSSLPRPATYVVPNLASLLVLPMIRSDDINDDNTESSHAATTTTITPPRTEFGIQVAKGLAETLNLSDFCQLELDRAFDLVDSDGNGRIDEGEVSTLLEQVYVATYGQQIQKEMKNFFKGFGKLQFGDNLGLTKEQFITRLKTLQNDTEGERKAFGLAKGLNLKSMSEKEMEHQFDSIDLDKNGLLDEIEYQHLLENVYVRIYGDEIKRKKDEFFMGFRRKDIVDAISNGVLADLTREQFTERLLALHQELDGGRVGSELAEVKTDADVEIMIQRFTPLLKHALNVIFDKFSSNGISLTQNEINDFLIKTNGELGRGGTSRHCEDVLNKHGSICRHDWLGVFARELSEGKWWQVVYDLEVCGFDVRSYNSNNNGRSDGNKYKFYEGWLDYIYTTLQLTCVGVQDGLTVSERLLIYNDGDALPNEWHPSDHIPVAAVFSWNKVLDK